MQIGMTILLCSLAYLLLTSVMYYSKQRIINKENYIYTFLIATSFAGITLELMCIYFVSHLGKFPILTDISNRSFLIYILIWDILFSIYIFTISFSNHNILSKWIQKNSLIIKITFSLFCFIVTILLIILPLNYYFDGIYVYSYGFATNFLYIVNMVFVVLWLFCLIPNIKKVGY